MAKPHEGQTFDNYVSFEAFLREYSEKTSQTFIVDDSRRIKAHPKLRRATQLKYSFVRLTCGNYGKKQVRKNRPVTCTRPNQQ